MITSGNKFPFANKNREDNTQTYYVLNIHRKKFFLINKIQVCNSQTVKTIAVDSENGRKHCKRLIFTGVKDQR